MEKIFGLEEKLAMPRNIIFRQIEDKFLAIASAKPNWLVLTPDEKYFVELLVSGATIGESLAALDIRVANIQKSESIAKSVLVQIESNGFYESIVPIDLEINNLPTRLQLYLTNECNLRCIHCYRSAGDMLDNELSADEWIKVIDDFNSVTNSTLVAFSGGEPLMMRNDFFRIAKESKNNGNENFLFTNGTLITNRNIGAITEYIDKIQVSLDGTTAEIHDKIRGRGSFKKTLAGLKLLKNTNINVMISYCMIPDTIDDVKSNLISFIESLDIKNIQVGVSLARKLGRWESNCGGCRDYSLGETYSVLEDTIKRIYEKGWDAPSSNRNMITRNCTFGQRLVIDSIGDAYPCAETIYKIGNIRTDSINSINYKLKDLYKKSNVENTTICAPCELRYICRGGCKTLRAKLYGSPFEQKCNSERKNLIYQKLAAGMIN